MTTHHPFPPARARSRAPARRPGFAVAAVVATVTGLLLAAAGPATALPSSLPRQTATTTTTIAGGDGVVTTTTVAGASTTTSSTTGSGATTSTVASPSAAASTTTSTGTTVPAWTATVPGPAPAPAVTAPPAEIAKADQLEQQITSQSEVLDVLAGQYDADQVNLATATAEVQQLSAQLTTSQAQIGTQHAKVTAMGQNLRRVAVDAYVDLQSGSTSSANDLLSTYENGVGQADAESALGKAIDTLHQLQQEEQQLQTDETAIAKQQQQAATAQAAAQAAATQAQAAAQNATTQQAQLLGLVGQDSGALAPLVTAAQDAAAQAAYQSFSTANNLDFAPSAKLSAPLPQAVNAVKEAEAQVGKPYQWGAIGPATFDCSGLTMWSWNQVGVSIPRVAAQQQAWTVPVPISQLQPGDLVFFGSPAFHVGMYIGDGLMVDAPHTGADVQIQSIWWSSLAGFGRIHVP